MRKTIHKLFWAWEYEKEEEWLNHMETLGLSLVSVGWCRYVFEQSQAESYSYRLELLENHPTHLESEHYITFMEGTGAQYLGNVMRWAYFRKEKRLGTFEVFSDYTSRIKHLNRILTLLGTLSLAELAIGMSNVVMGYTLNAPVNAVLGAVCLAVGGMLTYGFIRILCKKKKLAKEKRIFE